MSSIVNKIKDAVHPDKAHTSHTGPASNAAGPHTSNVANKMDPRVDSDRDGSHNMGASQGYTAGPHSSNMANRMDPRVDDGMGHTGGYTHSDNYTHSSGGGFMDKTRMTGPASNTAGPHTNNVANKMDPRVDSDRDGSRNMGASQGYTAGPHSSNMANKMDPRVDSDRDGSNTMGNFGGAGVHGHGTSGFASNQGNTFGTSNMTGTTGGGMFSGGPGPAANTAGPHRHDMANRMDPTVDSAHGPGPAPNTAGPHQSDALNKLDPRVDSDMDGSKRFGAAGGNAYPRTFNKDPFDAAHVPPSVLRKHVGDPVIEHGDHNFQRERRNSSISHQDAFRGV